MTKEQTLYEYLSTMYLENKYKFKNLQHNFINILYFIKNQIQTNTILTETQKMLLIMKKAI